MRYYLFIVIITSLLCPSVVGQDYSPTVINGVSVPRDFPSLIPVINETPAPGYIWVNALGNQAYSIIFQNDGTPVFYSRLANWAMGFTLHHNGIVSTFYHAINEYFVYDNNMNFIKSVHAQNGFHTDSHELYVAPNGNYLLIANEEKQFDLSHLPGGSTNTLVLGNHVQELDQDLNLVFEWNCWDLFEIDGTQENIGPEYVDFMHMNSIAVDYDGHILTSCRHLSECTKLHRTTGEIIWRFGGKYNQFELPEGDVEFSYQHTFEPVKGKPNHYTIFDNGNLRDPQYSRAVEYKLDTIHMTAEKVWEYSGEQSKFAWAEGSAQRLPNGNTLISFYCDNRLLVEVTESGDVVYEANYESNCTYRAYRYDWDGMIAAPYLVVENYPGQVNLIFNKFGDKDVDYFNIYSDTTSNPETLLATTHDTWYVVSDLEPDKRYFFKISAVSSQGEESDHSNIESASIISLENNVDLIKNGDFAMGFDQWIFACEPDTIANWTITEENFVFIDIDQKGEHITSIQLFQDGITLFEGIKYILKFDAEVENPRIIEAMLTKIINPWTNYSETGYIYLVQGLNSYEYEFVMKEMTDESCRVLFNLGEFDGDVKLGNIELIQVVNEATTTQPSYSQNGNEFFETSVYPVPFTNQLNIKLNLTHAEEIRVMLYDITGRLVLRSNVEKSFPEQTISLNTSGLNSGIYFYRLEFEQNNKRIKTKPKKIIKTQT